MSFKISVYDKDGRCKVCGTHVSDLHADGCEVGYLVGQIEVARGVANVCVNCCVICKHGNCSELCERCNQPKSRKGGV